MLEGSPSPQLLKESPFTKLPQTKGLQSAQQVTLWVALWGPPFFLVVDACGWKPVFTLV